MSVAGVRSNRGDGYQTAVAIDWAIRMLLDQNIASIDVDTTALVGDTPATVDDIVVRYVDGRTVYLQCKKNEPNFDAWTTKTLSDELQKVATLLRTDKTGEVMFCSRNNFGQIGKLREHLQTQPDHKAYIKSLTKTLKQEHQALTKFFGGPTFSSVDTFSLLQRVEFVTTNSIEQLAALQKAMLARHVTNPHVAYSAIWTAVDQLGARVVRADGGIHSLTRDQLFLILGQHECELHSASALGTAGRNDGMDGRVVPGSIRRAFTDRGEDSFENWQKRYESLVAQLQAQDPSSLLADAGRLLSKGDYDEAQRRIDEAIQHGHEQAATLSTAYASKAELQLLRFEHTAALDSLKLACHWAPDNTHLTTDYSNLLIKLEHYREVVGLLRKKLHGPTDPLTKACWHCNLGVALYALTDYEGAQKEFSSAEQLFASSDHTNSQMRSDLIHGLFANRGLLCEQRGDLEGAEKCYGVAIAYFRAELGEQPASLQLRLGLANVLNNLALLRRISGNEADIASMFDEAKSVLDGIDDWGARHELALIALNYGEFLTGNGQFELAEPLILQSLDIRRKAMKENPWHPAAAAAMCENLLGLSTLYLRSGRPVESLFTLEEARAQVEILRHADPVIYSGIVTNYATNATAIYRANWKFDEALGAADEAIRVLRKLEASDSILEDLATALHNKANVFLDLRNANEAGATYFEALKIRAGLARTGNHRNLGEYTASLCAWASLIPVRKDAIKHFNDAEQILNELVEEHPQLYRNQLAVLLERMAIHYTSMDCGETAVEYGRKAVRMFRSINRENDNVHLRELAGALCNLSKAHENRKDYGGAIDCLEEARQIFIGLQTENDPKALFSLVDVFEFLHETFTLIEDEPAAQDAIQSAIRTIEKFVPGTDVALNARYEETRQRLQTLAAKAPPTGLY